MHQVIARTVSLLLVAPLLALALTVQAAVPNTNFALEINIDPTTHLLEVDADI